MTTKEIFTNAPKLSEHEADTHFNERRLTLAAHLGDFIVSHSRFQNKEVSVTFAHKGISSLISIIETSDEKLVLKIPLSQSHAGGEAQFLKVWEGAGVKVPRVIEEGTFEEHSYTMMEFIDAPVLTDAYSVEEREEKGIFLEMGRTLRRMHGPEAEGYGRVVEGKPEFANFNDWLYSEDMEKRVAYVKEQGLLTEAHGSIAQAFETLEAHVKADPKSSYCHDDFGGANIFATAPITVFDPNPRFNNGYLDIGRSVLIHQANGVSPTQLIEGYFEDGLYDKETLYAAILLNTYTKFPYWHKVKRTEQIQRMQVYLTDHVLK